MRCGSGAGASGRWCSPTSTATARRELGCRIDRAYAGHGYGTEAFAAALAWGLKGWDLRRVTAKCFRENHPSRHMLAACMDPTGEDETYFYFEKCIQNKNDMHMDILSE